MPVLSVAAISTSRSSGTVFIGFHSMIAIIIHGRPMASYAAKCSEYRQAAGAFKQIKSPDSRTLAGAKAEEH